MWTYILITLTTVCCLIYLVLISRSRVVLPPAIPGALPIIGHAHLLLGDGKALWKTVKDFEDYCVKQGGVVHIKLGPKIFYLIADPDDYQNVLSNCLEKNYIYSLILGEWVGKGLVTAPVAAWKNLSKLLSPAFNQQVLYEYVDIHNSQAKALVSRLAQFCGKPFNPIAHHIKRAAFEVNILTAFGLELTDKISHSINQYMKAIDVITNVLSKRVQKVWLHHPALYKWSALKKQQDATMKIINDFSDSIMKQKREASNNKTKTGIVKSGKFKGFMDLAMELSAGGILTDLEILEQVNSTVFAGYETTSETLNLVLVVLGSYPHVQSRVYKELQEVLKGPNRDVRKEDLSKLFYLEAVIKEVCRLYCVAPVLLRYVDKDIKLKNYTLKAGSDCVVMVRAINRAEVWGPDREEFRPERWLEDSLPDNSNVYTGFGAGRRACLGRQFSLTLMKIFLAHLLRHYKVSADHTKLDMKLEITLKPVAGHYISIDPRH